MGKSVATDQIPHLPQIILFQCSTAVVQLTVNQLVVGSIPATGAIFKKDNMNVQPLHDKVLVAENSRENTTESGIVIQGAAGMGESKSGTVLAIGPDVTEVKVGDVVYLMWSKAAVVKVGDAQRVIIKQEDIVAVLES